MYWPEGNTYFNALSHYRMWDETGTTEINSSVYVPQCAWISFYEDKFVPDEHKIIKFDWTLDFEKANTCYLAPVRVLKG